MNSSDKIKSKIADGEAAAEQVSIWKALGKEVVFTNGCFDILHEGHVRYLAEARDLGDYLIIGINSDESVQRLKGAGRPIQNLESRAFILAAMECVDLVVPFTEDDPLNVIASLLPDVLVKGGDWPIKKIVGADIVKKFGGKVLSLPFHEGFSTTMIEQKIIDNKS